MAVPRKRTTKQINTEEVIQNVIPQINNPLVFISHDTRDADLAEEFSNLLKSASAGALKSFRSSDKKGTQGIEYGSEWYPAIMDKIDEASDVVCLLTEHSINRPWILYEAGVAKGKLDKKVIGIALGIPFRSAVTGPFAQFQNNDGDSESVTRLVLDLIKKVPGLDPDQDLVKLLVNSFIEKVKVITEKSNISVPDKPAENETSVTKLFEEVKIMFESLPSKIENRIDPDFRRKRRKYHPMMLEEFMHFGFENEDPFIGFLMLIGFYRDDFPWFYEIGMETYRSLKTAKTAPQREKILINFERATEMLSHPIMREYYGEAKDTYILMKETRHFFRRILEKLYLEKK